MLNADGRLSDQLLERASEGPRSKRWMLCPALVVSGSYTDSTPSRKSVMKMSRQLDRLRNKASFPAPLGLQPMGHHSQARLRPYLPALLDLQECVWLALMGGGGGTQGVGTVCTPRLREGRWIRSTTEALPIP